MAMPRRTYLAGLPVRQFLEIRGNDLNLTYSGDNLATVDHPGFLPALAGTAKKFLNGLAEWVYPDRLINPGFSTPSSVADGEAWIECSGVSPTRAVFVVIREDGAEQRFQIGTY